MNICVTQAFVPLQASGAWKTTSYTYIPHHKCTGIQLSLISNPTAPRSQTQILLWAKTRRKMR